MDCRLPLGSRGLTETTKHMAAATRMQALRIILTAGVVPLFHHHDPDVAARVLRAVAEGRGQVLEFTNRGDAAHETFAHLRRYARDELPGFLVGVGSVRDPATAGLRSGGGRQIEQPGS